MLREALAKVGLDLHPTKCKVQTNQKDFTRRGAIVLTDGFSIDVLGQGEHLELLGTSVPLEDPTGQEVEHRIACGRRKFWALKRLLLNRSYSLRKRLRLFNSTVTECALWGCES